MEQWCDKQVASPMSKNKYVVYLLSRLESNYANKNSSSLLIRMYVFISVCISGHIVYFVLKTDKY